MFYLQFLINQGPHFY